MAKEWLTDEEVEVEIAKLTESEEVRLARKEARLKYKRRQHLYGLRALEKRGKQLMEEGYTYDNIGLLMFGDEEDE